MKKLSKIILSLALVLTVLASATNYQAAEKATADWVNGYDWNAGVEHIYVFAADDTQSINTITGQSDGKTFDWWHVVLLEEGADGVCTVTSSEMASENQTDDSKLGQGKMALMAHSTISKADSYAFLTSLKVGDKVKLGKSFDELVGLDWGSTVSVSIEKATASSTPSTTPDAGSNNAGSNNAGSNNAGSNNAGSNVPSTGDATPVVAMASMLFVAVAFVALGLKKRNA